MELLCFKDTKWTTKLYQFYMCKDRKYDEKWKELTETNPLEIDGDTPAFNEKNFVKSFQFFRDHLPFFIRLIVNC